MKAAKRPQLRRLQVIDQQIRQGTYPSARRIADILEVNLRTVQRDLEFMQLSLKAPVQYCSSRKGWFYRDVSFVLPNVHLSKQEIFAVQLAKQSLEQSSSFPYLPPLNRAAELLASGAPELAETIAEEAQSHYSFRVFAGLEAMEPIFLALSEAIEKSRQMEIEYHAASNSQSTTRVIDPWHVISINGSWYLFAMCHLRQEMRMFAVSRIQNVRLLEQPFEKPQDFLIDDALRDAFQTIQDLSEPLHEVELICRGEAVAYIRERKWHSSQIIEPVGDQAIVIRMRLRSLIEIARWIQSWGECMEVVAPEKLRNLIWERATQMRDRNSPKYPQKPR